MSLESSMSSHAPQNPAQLIMPITNGIVTANDSIDSAKKSIASGIEQLFMGLAQDVGGIGQTLMNAIESALMEACKHEHESRFALGQKIENNLAIISSTLMTIDGALAKQKKKLQRLQAPGIKGTADAMPSSPVPPLQSVGPTQGPGSASQPPGPPPGGSLFLPPNLFPDPPPCAELQSLVIPMGQPGKYIGVGQLPPDFWKQDNDIGIFLSLQPTPLTVGQISILSDNGQTFDQSGWIFINSSVQMPAGELQTLMQSMGVDPAAIVTLSPQDAFTAASGIFSEPVVKTVWNVYNLPLPPVMEAPSTLPPLDSPGLKTPEGLTTPISTPALPGAAPIAPNGHLPGAQANAEAQANVNFTGIEDFFRGLVPNFALPTFQQACDKINPVYDYLGFPPEVRPPCTSLQQLRDYLNARLNS